MATRRVGILELAMQQWAEWRREGRSLRVAANLSARNLHEPNEVAVNG